MPDLHLRIGDVRPACHTATPMIAAPLEIEDRAGEGEVRSVLLNCQLQLEPHARAYSACEEARLGDLFGERERWAATMRPLYWMSLVVKVPSFRGRTAIDLMLPCSLDFDLAANKFFHRLDAGSVAVTVLFSGTIFFPDENGSIRIAPIPWDREARFDLPVDVWRTAVELHHPGATWFRLSREVFDRLDRYKVSRGHPLWESALTALLDQAERNENAGAALQGGTR